MGERKGNKIDYGNGLGYHWRREVSDSSNCRLSIFDFLLFCFILVVGEN